MKFPIGKYGPTADHRGAQVTLQWKGRTILGDVVGCYYDEIRGRFFLKVRHFNGEEWPIDPAILAVDVLERNYETEKETSK